MDDEKRKAWWPKAYEIFLRNSPVSTIQGHVSLWITKSNHTDRFFGRNTQLPDCGHFRGVDTRAILVVISRKRQMLCENWTLFEPQTTSGENADIHEDVKARINCVMQMMYTPHP